MVAAEADDDEALFFAEYGLVNVPTRVQMRQNDLCQGRYGVSTW
jgi:hypothetical protein